MIRPSAAIVVCAALCACAKGNYATMTVQYQARPDEWTVGPSTKQRIRAAFKQIAQAQGYKCNEGGKRVEDINCTGPKRMYVTFEPELNSRAYRVRFNWIEWHGRTRAEFTAHVQKFAAAMTTAVPDAQVAVTSEWSDV